MNSLKSASATAPTALQQRVSKLDLIQRARLLRELAAKRTASILNGGSSSEIGRAEPLRVEAAPAEWDANQTVGIYPAGPGQLQMWFLQKYALESPMYNTPIAFRLRGPLDIARLENAFQSIIRRHAALRTTVAMEEICLVQRVASSFRFYLEQVDLHGTPTDLREKEAGRSVQELARRPFNLSIDLPIRARLVRLDPDTHVLVVVMHHIISDGWSRSNLCRELSAFYAAGDQCTDAVLPPLSMQYTDYAAWQSKRKNSHLFRQQTAYWRSKLGGRLVPLALPSDHPRPLVASFQGDHCSAPLDARLFDALKARAQAERATIFMILLAAFKLLLHRYTHEEDLRVAVPIGHRPRIETENLIGPLINTLIMRTTCSRDMTFRDLLEEVKQTAIETYANADLPFENIVELLQNSSDDDGTPPVQTLFALQDFPETNLTFPEIEASPWPVNTGTAKVDIALVVEPRGSGWQTTIDYSTDLFEEDRVKRMLEHWNVLLESVAADPGQRLFEIPLLAAGERERVLTKWNRTQRDYAFDGCVHQLIEQQALRHADATAVRFHERSLTYRQLNERANQLAHELQNFDVGPDSLVGLSMERSPEMVIALLAILKAGGAYLPLDPANPPERTAFILKDAHPRVLVTSAHLAGALPVHSIPIIELDKLPENAKPEFSENPVVRVEPHNLAYTIYTSGSTGRPRGVLIEHRSLVNYTLAAIEQYAVVPADRILQFASLSFDASAEEIFSCLCRGATLVLRTEEMIESPASFLRHCAKWEITILHLPTAYWTHLATQMNHDEAEFPASLRLVAIGGERASPHAFACWREKVSRRVQLFNTYGPTETTITATWCELTDDTCDAPAEGELPIGRPVPNTTAYVLDQSLQPVPIGVIGELCIGGHALARGYLNQADLTAERFIANPFSNVSSPRLYRTGDKVRYRRDGLLEFHGRLDQQIKIRGYRIEPGEIESVLAIHPDVAMAAVISRPTDRGEHELAGFVVARAADLLSVAGLREWLTTKLPEYMVPNRFTLLPALPLTVNGKIDRRALLQMDGIDLPAGSSYVPPRNELERNLVEIWESVLDRASIGIRDNFFHLGGHSLRAVIINSRITNLLGEETPLRWIFEFPTIEEFAKQLRSRQGRRKQGGVIEKANRSEPLPMSFAQQGMWLLQQLLPDPATYNVPLAFRFIGVADPERIRRCLRALLERHEILRTALVQREGILAQEIAAPANVQLRWQRLTLSASSPDEKEALLRQTLWDEVRRPFDLAQAPLWRSLWIELAGNEHLLAFTFHHSIADEWSTRLFTTELTRLYAADGRIENAALPELPVQYADYTVWQRRRLTGDLLVKHRNYWRKQLEHLPPPLQLPSDLTPSGEASGRGGVLRFNLPQSVVESLRTLAHNDRTTFFRLALTMFHVWLYRLTGQADIIVGTPVSTRNRSELQSLLGFFLNTLPIRARLNPKASFRELLTQVGQTVFSALSHASLPFEQMVEIALKDRPARQHPIYQVMFVFVEVPRPTLSLDQVEGQTELIDTGTTKNDLMLTVRATADQWRCRFEYAADLFSAETVEKMARDLTAFVSDVAADPDQCLELLQPSNLISTRAHELPALSEVEARQTIVEWNETRQDYPHTKCVHELFEEQAECTPMAQAILSGQSSITYSELNARANRLAYHLRSIGVGPDVPVGVFAERSSEMLIALLAILKAGGAYVPIDPTLPRQRLNFVLSNSACAVVITENSLLSRLCQINHEYATSPAYVVLDGCDSQMGTAAASNLPRLTVPEHLAYIMYTSGSTGWPKGVEMPHRALVNLLAWQKTTSVAKAGSKTVQFASLSFDVSFQEIFSTWISGGTLVLIPDETRKDPAALLAKLADAKIERVFLPFVVLERLADVAERERALPESLKEIFVAGEPLRITPNIRQFVDRMPACRLWNHYGPTETHVVTAHELTGPASNWPDRVPIGRPLANCQVYLLDEQRQAVSVGQPGELCVGGVCLSRGYRQRPDLTAERFIRHPFSSDPNERVYCTGDICRWSEDGHLEYLGRLDHQIKIRGYRVELGEIENALCAAEGVREAVVVTRENGAGEKWPIAYVVADRASANELQLKAALSERLPDYMIPLQIEFIDALPLSPNGKVDRHALPEPRTRASARNGDAVLPRNLLELELTRLWQQLFDRKDISRHDNFFALGGYSLLAARLAVEIDKLIGRQLPIAALFQSPTIESLARRLTEENWAPAWSSLVPVQPLGSKPPFFFTHGWGGDVYAALRLAEYFAPDQPIYGVQAVGLDGRMPRHTSVEEMARHYVKEIRSFQPEGPYYLGGYSMGGLIAFEIAQQLNQLGQRVAFLGLLDTTPTSAPSTVYWRTLAPFLWERSRFHLQRWRKMPARDRFNYVRKCWAGLEWWAERNRPKPAVITSSATPNGDVPSVAGFKDYFWAVASAYKVRRYPGTIDVFLSESAHPALLPFWQHLAREGAVLQRIPGTHLEIIKPENLPALANLLKTALTRAQRNAGHPGKSNHADASRVS